MKGLVIFSDPPLRGARLRLDQEEKMMAGLAKRFSVDVTIERLHASNIDDRRERVRRYPVFRPWRR
jgi:hypothetical protein